METPILLHNPRCSKSREALALLEARGVAFEVAEYLKAPPTKAFVADLLTRLDVEPRALMRTGEPRYAELGLDDAGLGREEHIAALVANPALLQRPILLANGKAAIGRPPEAILSIL